MKDRSMNSCKSLKNRTIRNGFTLIEVLVAMAIIAVGVSALVASAGASAWRSDFLREREFGRWVASNALTELQVLPAWPDIGTKKTTVEMGNTCLLYTSPSPRDATLSRMPSSA